ncbi:hypothetical protein MBLNU230_g3229t2 [Neophaeotheca triangularis]
MASILSRKRDLAYLVFFATHIPVIFFIDAYNLWPSSLRPEFMTDLRTYYIETYQDQFFISPPPWFGLYLWFEVLYHVPVSVWAVGALLRGEIVLASPTYLF